MIFAMIKSFQILIDRFIIPQPQTNCDKNMLKSYYKKWLNIAKKWVHYVVCYVIIVKDYVMNYSHIEWKGY